MSSYNNERSQQQQQYGGGMSSQGGSSGDGGPSGSGGGGGGGRRIPSNFPSDGYHPSAGAGGPRGGAGAGGLTASTLDSHISDLFNRRSTGVSGAGGAGSGGASALAEAHGLDLLSGAGGSRRDSLESSAAVLDACILDLTRRRLSMHTQPGGPGGPGGGGGGGPGGGGSSSAGGPGGPGGGPHQDTFGTTMGGSGGPGGSNLSGFSGPGGIGDSHLSISLRQKQLQKQQCELEQRQRDLERQRQQLLAGIQETSTLTGGGGPGGMGGMGEFGGGGPGSRGGPSGGGGGGGGLSGGPGSSDTGGTGRQQWWVCHVCNSRAFSSRGEAMQHELICTDGPPISQSSHMRGGGGGSSLSVGGGGSAAGAGGALERYGGGPGGGGGVGGQSGFGSSSSGGGGQPTSSNMPDTASNGPFAMMPNPMPLAMASDKDWLTPLHCFVRRHCVQVFCATSQDVATPSKGKRKPIQVGQVGLRCPHCHTQPGGTRERGSQYFPTTISSIYNATMNLLQRHLHSCSAVPEDVMRRYQTLKSDDARSGTSKKYWVESALSLGLVDTPTGIRFSALIPPPLPRLSRHQHATGMQSAERRNSNEFFSTKSNAVSDMSKDGIDQDGHPHNNNNNNHEDQRGALPNEQGRVGGGHHGGNDDDDNNNNGQDHNDNNEESTSPSKNIDKGGDNNNNNKGGVPPGMSESQLLVFPEDKPYATAFSYHLLTQMQPCVFTEADRLGKRKGLPQGFSGLACRHCFGCFGSGRFFPSSIKTLSDTSKTLNVLHNHMMRCRKCPQEVKDTLEKLRVHHDDERAKMKFGSQKAFFAKIWRRLHENDGSSGIPSSLKRKAPTQPQQQQQQQQHQHTSGGGGGGGFPGLPGMGPPGVGGGGGYPHHGQFQGGGGPPAHNLSKGLDAWGGLQGFPDAKRQRSYQM